MWSGPRNLSTAMMRSWENRPDTEVLDEPLYAAYLASTGLDHPGSRRDHRRRARRLRRLRSPRASPRRTIGAISYQKHMAHHLLPHVDRSWLGDLRNCLLLRDPRRVLASYTKVRDEVTLDDIGIPQQVELAGHCELVVDSADFLSRPTRLPGRDLSSARCAVRRRRCCSGRPGPGRPTACGRRHWYCVGRGVDRIRRPADRRRRPCSAGSLADVAAEALEIYQRLRRDRLVLPTPA